MLESVKMWRSCKLLKGSQWSRNGNEMERDLTTGHVFLESTLHWMITFQMFSDECVSLLGPHVVQITTQSAYDTDRLVQMKAHPESVRSKTRILFTKLFSGSSLGRDQPSRTRPFGFPSEARDTQSILLHKDTWGCATSLCRCYLRSTQLYLYARWRFLPFGQLHETAADRMGDYCSRLGALFSRFKPHWILLEGVEAIPEERS